jgi:alanine racemase
METLNVELRDVTVPPTTPEEPAAEGDRGCEALPCQPPRPAWVEIDLQRLRSNYAAIHGAKPSALKVLAVVKDQAYGHGGYEVARTAVECGADCLALSTVQEAVELRERGLRTRMILLGDRHPDELSWCVDYNLTCCVGEAGGLETLARLAAKSGRRHPVHLKINTGMNRYGVHWTKAGDLAAKIAGNPWLLLEGVHSHFAQSDELDKTFASLQLSRFEDALREIHQRGIPVQVRHMCNSGGFLDLPQAHFDMVRVGMLQLGVFPSSVCRRIAGIQPVMSVKARVAAIQELQPGDMVGYGMRYTAEAPRRIAVLPIGYGDGFPRVRNQGWVLIGGRRAPLVGGVAMDAITVDVTEIPDARLWDEAVVMGRQGAEEITAQDIARLKNSVTYDVLTNWRGRLPRVYLGGSQAAEE